MTVIAFALLSSPRRYTVRAALAGHRTTAGFVSLLHRGRSSSEKSRRIVSGPAPIAALSSSMILRRFSTAQSGEIDTDRELDAALDELLGDAMAEATNPPRNRGHDVARDFPRELIEVVSFCIDYYVFAD